MRFPALFAKGKVGALEPKNRFVMPPMVRDYADRDGFATPRYAAHIERVARGGIGMMILEAGCVRPDGRVVGEAVEAGRVTDAVAEGALAALDIG
ncbi:MAG: hypothetical protein RL272_1220 [Candidatus Parcubacteria bacterium]|jgi:2,4-dienoyl-CoA reductase-like NADH-dependent reductase (Old Yellow Enzyme family)